MFLKCSRNVRLVSPIYCFLHFLHSFIDIKLVELQVMGCFMLHVRAGETAVTGIAAESASRELACLVGVFGVLHERVDHEGLVNDGKGRQVLL